MKEKLSQRRIEIGKIIQNEIKEQGVAIEAVVRQSISKQIIYNIIQG